jgi:hypothetical protein
MQRPQNRARKTKNPPPLNHARSGAAASAFDSLDSRLCMIASASSPTMQQTYCDYSGGVRDGPDIASRRLPGGIYGRCLKNALGGPVACRSAGVGVGKGGGRRVTPAARPGGQGPEYPFALARDQDSHDGRFGSCRGLSWVAAFQHDHTVREPVTLSPVRVPCGLSSGKASHRRTPANILTTHCDLARKE